jgi:hypothetical protein
VESIRHWWDLIGRDRYPGTRRLLITCDAGGSNDPRKRVWKAELARLAAGTGLEITVCHFPPTRIVASGRRRRDGVSLLYVRFIRWFCQRAGDGARMMAADAAEGGRQEVTGRDQSRQAVQYQGIQYNFFGNGGSRDPRVLGAALLAEGGAGWLPWLVQELDHHHAQLWEAKEFWAHKGVTAIWAR